MTIRPTLALLALASGALAGCAPRPELPVHGRIEALRLETSRGGLLETADLDGKIYVVDFIFTSCQMACPLMSAKMKRLAEELEEAPEVRFLSISTDPARDTVPVLDEYAGRFGADGERWIFGRAGPDELERLSEKEFLLGAAGFPAGHSLKFVLVDGERRIRGYYDSEEARELDALRRDVRRLLAG